MKKICILLIIFLCKVFPASAQLYRHLNTEDGLSSRRVIAVEKDTKGYMWFLTQEGIDRYNGKQYQHYKLSEGNKIIQHFPNLNYLHVDNQGDIWTIGKNGYAFKYNSYQEKFDLILNFSDSIHTFRRLPLTYTFMDNNDNLWLCTKTSQYIYQTKTKRIVQLISPIQEEITFITQSQNNQYFIGTNHRIYQANLLKNQLIIKSEPLLNNFHIIQHLYYHPTTQSLLIGTMLDGFYLYNIQKSTLESIGNLKDVTINRVIPASKSNEEVLIATDGNGVYKFNFNTKELSPYFSTNNYFSNKMNGDIIKDIYLDEEERIWMAVFPVGITIYSEKYPAFEWFQYSQDKSNSLSNNQITYLLEDSDGDIWATTSNGVSIFNIKTKTWENILSSYQKNKYGHNHVFISLCESTPGTILVGGYMSGMYRINKKDMIPHYFSPQSEGNHNIRPDKYIRSIYRDQDGIVWAGGYYNFKRINPSTKEMEYYSTDYPITYITSKNDKELWIGTINGLYKFNKNEKKIKQVNLSSDIGTINSIYQANEKLTYLGTHGSGLWIYNNQTSKLENYHRQNSALISNNIFCILPSNRPDELILSTENELVCFNIQNKSFKNWTKEQGLQVDNFNTSAGLKSRNGQLIFGSDNGLIIIKDSVNLPHIFQSKLLLSSFNIQYQKIIPGIKGSPLSKPIDETQSIILSHDQNIFSLEVSSINYDCPSRILYSWKLDGFYDEWTQPSENNIIRYTGLAPGKYILKVRAILLDDGHTLEERELRITIQPPFTQTIWAFLLYLIIIVLVTFAIMRYLWLRKDSFISREKIQFFINTAHDIRTPLTLIKGPLNEIKQTERLSAKGYDHLQTAIQNTNRLSELATKLIDFQKEELYDSKIHVSRHELNQYLDDFLKQFKAYAEKKGLLLQLEKTTTPLYVWIDRNKIDSIIHNILSNALKYTPENGQITISIQSNSYEWYLKISDTGIGISDVDQRKLFKQLFRGENAVNQRITGTGIGMLQTYRLVKRHLGKISVTSIVNTGTTFHLKFPINHPKYLKQEHSIQEVNRITSMEVVVPSTNPSPCVQNGPHILIVEDNPELRHFLIQCLSEIYQITEAENGKEALELIERKQPELIISDIMMPTMRGDDMCQILKSHINTSHIPIILLTALGDRESILRGLEIKADSYIVKPFDIDILKANIASVLANKEFLRQRFARLNYQTGDLPKEIQETPGLNLDQNFLIKITDLIRKNLGKDFNVDNLCQEMGMSRSSLYSKIKALTNHSPSEFVRQIRIQEAAILLKSKKYTIAEVSDLMGYSDPKYFTDIFKKHYGITPSAYMKKERT